MALVRINKVIVRRGNIIILPTAIQFQTLHLDRLAGQRLKKRRGYVMALSIQRTGRFVETEQAENKTGYFTSKFTCKIESIFESLTSLIGCLIFSSGVFYQLSRYKCLNHGLITGMPFAISYASSR
jgi:hypothetical protein